MSSYLLRLRLLMCDRVAGVMYILCSAVIAFVLLNLNIHAQDSSRIPIGIEDDCGTQITQRLISDISTNETLKVYTGTFEELNLLLKDGYLNCILRISPDYEEKVRRGDQEGLITVFTPKDDTSSVIVQDIVAGYMMYDICFFKGYDDYVKLPDIGADKLTLSEFSDYVLKLKNNPMYEFNFDISYVDVESSGVQETEVTNALIYKQIIAGLNALLLMLMVLCGCNSVASEGESGINKRRSILTSSKALRFIQETAAVFTYMLPVMILSSFTVFSELGIRGTLYLFCLNAVFTFGAVLVFMTIARIIRSASAYQLVGTVLSTVLGVCGFVSVFSGVLGMNYFEYTPVAGYISFFMKLN